ncbi:hypothetical protein [Nitrosopumilus spindle-shaped virus]|uniref:Uncharacterized protein n=1 Tax=Nitrosopumilus spindle-shaped virus TaxID=2508184 RepID=A0A514K3A0_9VIRU|nr:hypothetical protein [Nitrosopumilus spindle-shaped virus]
MFDEIITRIKISRKLKQLRDLEKIRNLKEDLQILDQDIKKTLDEIKELNQVQKDNKQNKKHENLDKSIFNRCKRCDTIYLKSKSHKCYRTN